jgi:hypothetical protein
MICVISASLDLGLNLFQDPVMLIDLALGGFGDLPLQLDHFQIGFKKRQQGHG